MTVSRINRLSRVAELSSKILRRLLETGQRVETQPTRTLVIRQPQNLAPGGAVVETGPTTRQSPWGSRVGGPGMAQGSPPAAIDLELLTEKVVRQIEQRIVAYRERMGKLF